MINWEVVICFVSIVIYLFICIFSLQDFFRIFESMSVSKKRCSFYLSIVLGFMVFGLLFLFFVFMTLFLI